MSLEHSPGRRLPRPKQVMDKMGWSRTTLWRRVRAGEFPAPVKIGPSINGFYEDEADEAQEDGAAAMVALLKYGYGFPFNRLERLQENLGIPLPAATQWDIVVNQVRTVDPVYGELIRQAAQGEVLHNDETTMKILEFMGLPLPHDVAFLGP